MFNSLSYIISMLLPLLLVGMVMMLMFLFSQNTCQLAMSILLQYIR